MKNNEGTRLLKEQVSWDVPGVQLLVPTKRSGNRVVFPIQQNSYCSAVSRKCWPS